MARKKEPERAEHNRARILETAQKLFLQNGVAQTSMEDIARQTGICKATLYTCYPNQAAIKNDISLEAMRYLYAALAENTDAAADTHENFRAVCAVLLRFQERYPLSFQLIVENISVEDAALRENTALREIYETGEKINGLLLALFSAAFQGQRREEVIETLFALWGSIYGLIVLAGNKAAYLQKATGKSREQFLQSGFDFLYRQFAQGGFAQPERK